MVAWITENWAAIASVLLVLSELLDAIPAVKASSIWKLIYDFIKKITTKE